MTQPSAEPTFYEVLGVPPDADQDTIKRTYRRLARELHPDANPSAEAADRFKEVSLAYATLGDPDKRSEYDISLTEPTADTTEPPPPEEYVDDWGDTVEWEPDQEETVDVEVVPDATPTDTPTPVGTQTTINPRHLGHRDRDTSSGDWPQGPFPKQRFRHPSQVAAVAMVCAVIALLMVWLASAELPPLPRHIGGHTIRRTLFGVGILLGVILGVLFQRPPRPNPRNPPKPQTPTSPGVMALFSVAGVIGAWVLLPRRWAMLNSGIGALAITIAATTVCIQQMRLQRNTDRFLPRKLARDNWAFGRPPGTVAADLLTKDLLTISRIPAVRMFQCSNPLSPFSHVVIAGRQVVLLRALVSPGGGYRWSGPSLFHEQVGNVPTTIISGPYAEFLNQAQSALGKKVQVQSWVVIYPTVGSSPEVTQTEPDPHMPVITSSDAIVEQVGATLASAGPLVDQVLVAEAARLLSMA